MIKVIKPGFFTTIQDLGRTGFQQYGVPYSGVMDRYSAKLANALLHNDTNDALLEMTMTGPTLQFSQSTCICITGANMTPVLNDVAIKQNNVIRINVGDIISFGKLQSGFRAYLAVSGGFRIETVMGSRSMYKDITSQFKINRYDELLIVKPSTIIEQTNATIKVKTSHFSTKIIEVFKGPEFEMLSDQQREFLFSKEFTISKDNSRMAYLLTEVFSNHLEPIITSLVLPGTVQLTPSGKLIILMRDCQTTGGYPRILQLKETSIDVIAQKFVGHRMRFVSVD